MLSEPEIDWEMTPLGGQRGWPARTLRRAILLAIMVIVVAVVLVPTAPLWLAAAHTAITRLAPRQPYTGPLLYGYSLRNRSDLLALSAATGETVWQRGGVWGAGVVLDDHHHVLTVDLAQRHVLALDTRTGQMRWQSADDAIMPTPVLESLDLLGVADGAVLLWQHGSAPQSFVVPSSDVENMVALSATTGQVRWRHSLGAGSSVQLVGSDLLVGMNAFDVATRTQSYALQLIDAATGTVRWQAGFDATGYGVQCGLYGGIVLCEGGAQSAEWPQGHIWAFTGATGQPAWQLTLDNSIAVAATNITLVTSTVPVNALLDPPFQTDTSFSGYELASGKQLWTHTGAYSNPVPVAGDRMTVLLQRSSDRLLAYDSTGELLWYDNLPATSLLVGATSVAYQIFVLTTTTVQSYDIFTGDQQWNHPLSVHAPYRGFLPTITALAGKVLVQDGQQLTACDFKGNILWRQAVDVMPLATDSVTSMTTTTLPAIRAATN